MSVTLSDAGDIVNTAVRFGYAENAVNSLAAPEFYDHVADNIATINAAAERGDRGEVRRILTEHFTHLELSPHERSLIESGTDAFMERIALTTQLRAEGGSPELIDRILNAALEGTFSLERLDTNGLSGRDLQIATQLNSAFENRIFALYRSHDADKETVASILEEAGHRLQPNGLVAENARIPASVLSEAFRELSEDLRAQGVRIDRLDQFNASVLEGGVTIGELNAAITAALRIEESGQSR